MSDIPSTSGIYRITCIPNGRIYIGSSVNLYARWQQHRQDLINNTHHSITLQRAWNKYGECCFIFEVIELTLVPFLLEREQYWLDKLKPFDKRGFNIARVAGSRLGLKASDETLEKLRISHTGKRQSEQAKQKLSTIHKGREFSNETKERIRLAKLGHGVSPEARAKISANKMGHTYTPELYASRMKTLIVTFPDGTEKIVTGIRPFCREHNLNISHLLQVAKGNERQHKGYKARFPD